MATRPELEHSPTQALQQNRKRLRASQDKVKDIADRGVAPPPPPPPSSSKGPRDGPMRSEGSAKSLSNRSTDFALVEGKSDDALGIKRARVKKELKADNNVAQEKPGRSDTRRSDLTIPVARAKRMSTEDGRTSFHFSHDSVTKTNREVVNEKGRANRPGAAKAHNKYIERDSAVALDQNGAEIVPANDVGMDAEIAPEAAAINDNDGAAVDNQENTLVAPIIGRAFLRSYRGALAALFADPDGPTGRAAPGEDHGLQHVPGGRVVPDGRDNEMLLWSSEVPVVRGDGAGGAGLRRERDGNPEGDRGSAGPVDPRRIVPARLPRQTSATIPVAEAIRVADGAAQVRPAANDPRTPEGQGVYIERQEAMAIQPDGSRVLYTNIDADPEKRAEFWRLVEEHEREAEPDKISFQIDRNPEYWAKVAGHAKCPPELSEAIANAKPDMPVRIGAGDNVDLRRFLSRVEGWHEVGARGNEETPEDYRDRRKNALCQFHDGRGGRVQYRIIGELPHELDIAGRASVLKTFSQEFERRKLPFVSVMHAPDHTNSDKNWHFHLVYYDRPCDRITAETLAKMPKDPNERNAAIDPIGDQHIGQWDFAVVERYKTSSREIRERRPLAQEKSKEVNRDKAWIEILRKKLADITNNHLEEAGIERRVDPRRHEEMGIHADPQEHLGTRLANLEAMGIATPRGVSNEERQWKAVLEKLDRDLQFRKNATDRQATKWLRQLEQSGHGEDVRKNVRSSITRWHQHRIEAEEHDSIAVNVDEHMERLTSRAEKVLGTCRKHLDAIDEGRATKFQSSRQSQLQDKADEAQEWLAEVSKMLATEKELARDSRKIAERERLFSDVLENGIEKSLREGGRAMPAPRAEKVVANDQERTDRDQATARRATNAEIEAWITRISAQRRRLKRVGRDIHPAVMTDEDRVITASENYPGIRNRLVKMKDTQDRVIKDVAEFIAQRPDAVIRQRGRDAQGYVLIGARKALSDAFIDYQEDPVLVTAREAAIQARQEQAERAQVDKAANDRRDVQQDTNAGRQKSDAAARQRAISDAIMAAVSEGARRVQVKGGVARLSADDMVALKATADQIADPDTQKRLVALSRTQASDIRRLQGFIRSNPSRLVEKDEGFALRSNAPVEMAEIGLRWGKDQALADELRKIRDDAAARTGKTIRPAAPERVAASQPRPAVDRPAVPAAERPVTPSVDRPAVQPAERPVVPAAGRPARQEDPAPKPIAPATERVMPKPAAPAPERVQVAPVEAAPVAPSTERITTLRPDLDMREQARKRAEEQRAAKEAAEARRKMGRRRVETDAASASERVAQTAAQRTAMATAHPLISDWSKANQEGRMEDRRRIAFEITENPAARAELKDHDRAIVRRIRDEAERVREERQPSLGLSLDQGVTPKRGN